MINDTLPAEAVPGINKWNWGAASLGFIWGIPHGVWISLLTLIPYVNFIVLLYLGIKGNELAWNAKQWESVEQFHAVQKRWAIAGLVVLAVSLFIFLVVGSQYLATINAQIETYSAI